jgi:hypothetical protein
MAAERTPRSPAATDVRSPPKPAPFRMIGRTKGRAKPFARSNSRSVCRRAQRVLDRANSVREVSTSAASHSLGAF